MWLVPNTEEMPKWKYIGRVSGDRAVEMCQENLYHRGKYRPLDNQGWRGKRRGYIRLIDRPWFTFLDGRIAANDEQVKRHYINDISKTTSRVSVRSTRSTLKFSKMDYEAYKQWVDKTMRERKRKSVRAADAESRRTILFFLTSSEYGYIKPFYSYNVYLSEAERSKKDWSELNSGQIVESASFSYVMRDRKDTWQTPLKSADINVSRARSRRLDRMLSEEIPRSEASHWQLYNQVMQTLPRTIDSDELQHYKINPRWVETLMGLPENMVNPYGEYLIENEAVYLPLREWRNNG